MNKTITTLAILLTLLTIETQASQLFLRTYTYQVKANIAGRTYFAHNGEFTITELGAGNHFATIRETRITNYNNRGRDHRNPCNIVFLGAISIPHASQVFASITPRGILVIEHIVPLRPPSRVPPKRCSAPPRQGQVRDYGPNQDNRNKIRLEKSTHSFNQLLIQISNASFESDRKIIVLQYLTNNTVTSDQVLKIMKELAFESNKLEIAKRAYLSTADPDNYYIVNNGFNFSSSIASLDRYLSGL